MKSPLPAGPARSLEAPLPAGPARSSEAPLPVRPARVDAWDDATADAVIGFAFADIAPLQGSLGLLDWYLCGTITQAIRRGTFAAAPQERLLLPAFGPVRPPVALVVGLGALLACEGARLRAVARDLARVAGGAQIRRALVCLPAVGPQASPEQALHASFCATELQRAWLRDEQAPAVSAWLSAPQTTD